MESQSTFLSRIGQMFWELLGYVTSAVQQYLTPAPPNTGNNDTNISPEARVCEEKNSDKEEEDNYLREETKRERKCWSHVNTADERVANLVQREIVLSNQMESMSEQCMPVYVTSTEEEQVNQHPEKTVLEKAGRDKGDITQDIIKLGVEVEDTYIFANEQEKKTQHDKTTDDESDKSVDQRTEKKIELVEETDVRLPGDRYPFGEEDESKQHIKKERKSARKYEDLIQSNEVSVFRGHTEKHDVTEKMKGESGIKEVVMTCEDMTRDSNGKTAPVAGETPFGEDKVLLSDTIDTREIEPGETADGVEEGQRSNEENERCTEESMGIESITKTSMGVLERGSKGEEMRGEWQGVQKSQRLETKKRSYKKDFAGANERDISYLYELRREDRLGEEYQKKDGSTVGKNGEEYQPVQKEKVDNRKKAEKEEKSYEEKQEAKIEGEFGSGIYGSFETAIKEVDVNMENRESDKVGQEEEKRGAEQNETAEMGLQERFQVVENEIKYETIMVGEGQDESRKTQMAGQNEIQREEESAEVDKNETQRKEKSKEEEILPESVLTLNMGQYERTKEWVKEEGDVNKLRDELDEEDRDESDLIEESGEDGEWERCLFELEIEENNESEGMRDMEILHEERWREESKTNQGVAESWVDVGKSVEANKEAAEENKAISGTEWRDGKKHEGEVYEENKKGREERSSKENSAGAEVSIEDGESDKVKEEEENRGAELNEMAEIEMQEREEERVEEEGNVDKLRDELDEEDKSQGSVTEERDESGVIEESGEDGERERCLFELEKEENNIDEGMRNTEILHEERWIEDSRINEEVAASWVDLGQSVERNKKVTEENKDISGTEWKDNINHEREEYKEREREERSSKEKPTGAEVGMEDGESDQVREEEENRRAEKNEMVEVEVQEKLLLMEPEIKDETIMAGEEEMRTTQMAGQDEVQREEESAEVEEDAKQRYEKSKDEIILPEGVFTLNMGQFETEKDRVEEEGDVDKLRDELDEEDHNQGSVTENIEEADVIEEGGEDGERLRCLFNLENEEINDSEGMRDTEILHEERCREESKINKEVAESLVDVGESVETNKKVAEENKEISGTEWKDNINHEREEYKERESEERSSKEEPAGAEVSMEDRESDQVREEEENRRAEKNEIVEVEVQEKLLLMEPEIKHETIMAGEGEEERRKTQRAGQHKIQGQTQGNEVKLPEMVITLNTGQSEEEKEGMEEEGDLEKLRDELDEENKNLGPVTENIEESALIEEGGEDGERERCLFESEKEENNDSEGMRDTEILHETRWKEESKIYEEVAASWVGVGESMKASKEVAEENKEISGTEWKDDINHEGEVYKEKEREREERSPKEEPTGVEVSVEDGELDKVQEEEENRRVELNERVEIEVQEREKERVEKGGDVDKLRDELDEENKRQGSVTEYRDESDVIEESGEDGERERCLFELEKEENNDSEGMRDTEILHEERWREESKINEEVAASGVDVGESVETNKKVAEENKEISGTEWKDNINHEREDYKEREREERSSKEKPTGAEVGMEDGESDQVREEKENRRAEKNEMVEVKLQEKLLLMEPEIKDETIMAGEEEMRTTQMAGQDEVQREEESAEVEEDAKQRYEKSKDKVILPEGVFIFNMGQFETEKDRVVDEGDVDKLRDDLDEENKKQGSVTENIEESDVIEEGGEDGERERCLFDLEKEENNDSEGMKETEILHEERWREESKINEEVTASWIDVGESETCEVNVQNKAEEKNVEISVTELQDDRKHRENVYEVKEQEILDISTEEQPYENFNIFHEALDMSKENETKIDLQETKESRIHEDNIFGRNSHVIDLFKVAEEQETKKEERDNECLEKQPTILIVREIKDEGHVSDENVDIKTMEEGDGMDLNVAPATKSELIEGFSANVEKEGITLRDGWAIEKTKETRNNDGSQSGDTPYALDRGGIRGAESGRDINECTMSTTEGQRPKIQLKIEKGVKLEEDENFTNAKEIQSQFSDAKLHKTSEHGKLWAETAGQSRTRIVNEETDGNEGRKHITKDGPGKKRIQKRTHENEEEFNLQLDSPSLDFTAQKSRIALKNRHVRAPKDPRILLQIPSLSPTSAPPTLVEEAATKPVGIKVGGVGMMGFKLPGIGAGFPVLKKTERRVEERGEESTGQMTMKAPTPNLGPDDSEPAATKKWAAGSVGVMLPGFGPGMPALRKTDKGVKLIEKSTDDATVPHGKHDTSSGGGAERNGEESKEKGVKSVGPSTIKLPSFGAGFPVLRKTEMGSKLRGKEGKTSEGERNETENNQPEKPGSDSPMLVSELKKRFMKTERK